jgi:hypothetical protein
MLTKLFNLVAVVSIGTLLALGGIVGYLSGSGQITPQRWQWMLEVARGEHDEVLTPQEAADPNAPVQQEDEAIFLRDQRESNLRDRIRAKHLLDAQVERALKNVVARQELLDQAMQELLNKQDSFASSKEQWKDQRSKIMNADQEAGFKQELETVASLDSEQAKTHLVMKHATDPASAVRLLRALPVGKRKRILAELKTPQETKLMHELLEQLSNSELAEIAP